MATAHQRNVQRIAAKFGKEEIRVYRKHFDKFDLNHDGVISAKELDNVSRHMGYNMSKTEIKEIMKVTDLDESGDLNFEEFLLAMPGNRHISTDEHKAAEIRRKFLEYDMDHNGHVTVEEAHEILRQELAFSPEQSAHLVHRYDKTGDGRLCYEEFVQFYKNVRSKAKRVRTLFDEFDRDHSGGVSVSELKYMMNKVNIPDSEVEGLLALYDKNKDGELQYDEFVAFLLRN